MVEAGGAAAARARRLRPGRRLRSREGPRPRRRPQLLPRLVGGMFGMRASGVTASWVVGRMGTDAHLYDDPEDAAILALLDSRFDAHV
ncbi:hypothetical protein ZWY2020_058936 [Hordeum vulgare]|nr:hypothetical protein ZWY2020_058936 [Hordeum vulgare]